MGSLEGKTARVRKTGLLRRDSRPPRGLEEETFTDLPLQLCCGLSSPDKSVDCQRRPQGQAQLLGRLMPCINI